MCVGAVCLSCVYVMKQCPFLLITCMYGNNQ